MADEQDIHDDAPTLTPSVVGEREPLPGSFTQPDSSPVASEDISVDCEGSPAGIDDGDRETDDIVCPEQIHQPDRAMLSETWSPKKLSAEAPAFVPRGSSGSSPFNCAGSFLHQQQQQIPRMIRVSPQTHPVPIYPLQNSPVRPGHGMPQFYGYAAAGGQDASPPFNGDSNLVDVLTEELTQKIVKQVEYYFGDANLATNDHLYRILSKDPEGYVPISVIASFKKIKTLVSSLSVLADALRKSSILVVSEDGKKVKRVQPLSDADVEDFQARTVVVENLPEDHSHPNLEKIFSVVGSVKSVRICHPQHSNGAASAQNRSPKMGTLVSNKLHAFVEFETLDQAEKAVSELNDARNWRSGLRVRMLLKRTVKVKPLAHTRGRKAAHDNEADNGDEETVATLPGEHEAEDQHHEDEHQLPEQTVEQTGDEAHNDKEGGGKRGKGRGHGKGRGRGNPLYHHTRGGHPTFPHSATGGAHHDQATPVKNPPGPRMPDGTRGFTMGRGKPLVAGGAG